MGNSTNYYELLAIPNHASNEAIRERIAAERHQLEILKRIPAKRAEAEKVLALLAEAAAVLLDPEARKRLDESLAKGTAAARNGQGAASAEEDAVIGNSADTDAVSARALGDEAGSSDKRRDSGTKPGIQESHKTDEKKTNGAANNTAATLPEKSSPVSQSRTSSSGTIGTGTAPVRQQRNSGASAKEKPASMPVPNASERIAGPLPASSTQKAPPQPLKIAIPPSTGVPPPPPVKEPTQVLPLPQPHPSGDVSPVPPIAIVPGIADEAAGGKQQKSGSGKALAALFAVAVIVGGLYIASRFLGKVGSSGAPTPSPTTITMPGRAVDLRPPRPSLLNPPIIAASPAAARDPRMAQGQLILKHDAGGLKITYPDNRNFIVDSGLYHAAGPMEAIFSSDYGTWVIQTKGSRQGNVWGSTLDLQQLRDINGDGWPELVLDAYSGEQHCCTALMVLSFRPEGPAVVFAEQLGSASATMRDLDGDGRKEILTDHLFESVLGNFARGTPDLPVAYSAGADGVYRANTRAFRNWLQNGYEQKQQGITDNQEREERNTTLIDLFFLAYLSGKNDQAYSYLAQLQPTPGHEHPLLTLQRSLKEVAPEVVQEQPFQQVLAGISAPVQPPAAQPAAPVQIKSFEVDPETIQFGQPVNVRWEVEHAQSVGTPLVVPASGTKEVTLSQNTQIILEAQGAGNNNSDRVARTVHFLPPNIVKFRSEPNPVAYGDTFTLDWMVTGASEVNINRPELQNLPLQGSREVVAEGGENGLLTYTLKAESPGGPVTVYWVQKVLPKIVSFDWKQQEMGSCVALILSWNVHGVANVTVDSQIRPASSYILVPPVPHTYKLEATNAAGKVAQNRVVIARPAAKPCLH
jgi:hypothetical protein